MSGPHRLRLYYRSGCSLCEEMQAELMPLAAQLRLQLEQIDVDNSAELVERYGHKVPVLTSGEGEEICHYFLDREALDSHLQRG